MRARRLLAGICWLGLLSCAEPEEATRGGSGGAVTSGTGGTEVTGGMTTGGMTTGGMTTGGMTTGGMTTGGMTTGGEESGGATGGTETGGASGSGGTGGSVGCDRAGLQAAVDAYLAAMEAGDPSLMPLAASATYVENAETVAFGQGLWATPLHADQALSLFDVSRCASFTEVIIATGSHDYVNGVRLDVSDGQISAISVIATDADDWGFDGDTYLSYSRQEVEGGGWDEVPEGERYGYDELVAAGEAYFAFWADKSLSVPWGVPCARLEGGMYTGYRPGADCSLGIPDQSFAPRPTDSLADVDRGMSVIFLNLPGPDSHLFRVQKTYPNMESPGIRYVHTLTVCYVNGEWQCPGEPPTG